MSEIREWLESIGFGQYGEAFEANDIDMDLLKQVNDQTLKDIGVTSAGHRLRISNAIAKLVPMRVAGVNLGSTTAAHETTAASAERRQLTIMFCDLVGSTALSAKLDPEDLRSIISAYHHCCTELVEGSGGFVAKYMGDGVLCYFGYPQAHEHDAERAVRAGLSLVDEVSKLKTTVGAPLQVRIGIATGLVVVGDLLGRGSAQEQAVVGETPNLAARLQAFAEPGAVVIASSTHQLTGGLFEYRDLGTVALKGFADNVQTWEVLGASGTESRFEALRATTSPLVGRDEEIDLLVRRWEQVKRGEGCVVLISGEPGIGKSRIAQTVLERLSAEPHTRLRYFCSPHHQDSALYPSIAQLERAAGFRRDDTPEQRLAKLEAVLSQATSDLSEVAPLVAHLLSIPTGGRYPALSLSPQKRKERTLRVLIAQMEGLAACQPVLIVFEDIHWSDHTTREALDLLIDRVPTQRALLIVTFRPEFTPPWIGRPHVTLVTLGRLSPRQRVEMITHVTGGRKFPREIFDQIVDRTDGVPLFIEELTKNVVEGGFLVDAGGRFAATGPVHSLAIPTTLHASLLARLDRSAPMRDVAQIGAALGRSFSHELISAVAGISQGNLDGALDQLVRSELIFCRGIPPDAEYTFKHALVQDVAYSTLLRTKRQKLHARIATALECQFPEIVTGQPELIAHHFTEAGAIEAAIEWWAKAGERAIQASAYKEAVAHLTKAISLAEALADSPEQRLVRLRLQTAYGYALFHDRGQTAVETVEAFVHARALAAAMEDITERAAAYYGMWAGSYLRADLNSMCETADAFLKDAQRCPGSPEAGIAHRVLGTTRWVQGDYVGARAQLERGVASYDHERDRHLAPRFGFDIGVMAMANLALALWPLGDVDRATHLLAQAVGLALKTSHMPTVILAHNYNCQLASIRREPDQARPHANAILRLGREHSLPLWLAVGTYYVGWARWWDGDRDGEAGMRIGLALLHNLDVHVLDPSIATSLAEVEAGCSRIEAGLATLDAQLAAIDQGGQRWLEAEVHRVRGELLIKRKPLDVAAVEAAFLRSIEIARAQQTRTFELRAALSLAKLYHAVGRAPAARELLPAAMAGLAESPELPEVAAAHRLLASREVGDVNGAGPSVHT
jgi:class 3 adenylate cyclase/predicted ATPase